jgi:hypothetical protein
MKEKIFLMMGVCAMALTSCSDDEIISSTTDGDKVAIKVFSTLNPYSRAIDSSWEANDKIGITSDGIMTNKEYVTEAGDGVFTAVNDPSFYKDTDSHTFAAYYPYHEYASANTISFAVSSDATPKGQKDNDFLWATATGSATSPSLRMNFAHKMTRLVFNVKTDGNDGFYADDIFGTFSGSTIKSSTGALSDAFNTASFNITTGNVTTTGERQQLLMTAGTDDKYHCVRQYVVIIPEQESCDYKHIFNKGLDNEQVFTATLDSQTWKAGYSYTYNIVIGRSRVSVADAIIDEWIDGVEADASCRPSL